MYTRRDLPILLDYAVIALFFMAFGCSEPDHPTGTVDVRGHAQGVGDASEKVTDEAKEIVKQSTRGEAQYPTIPEFPIISERGRTILSLSAEISTKADLIADQQAEIDATQGRLEAAQGRLEAAQAEIQRLNDESERAIRMILVSIAGIMFSIAALLGGVALLSGSKTAGVWAGIALAVAVFASTLHAFYWWVVAIGGVTLLVGFGVVVFEVFQWYRRARWAEHQIGPEIEADLLARGHKDAAGYIHRARTGNKLESKIIAGTLTEPEKGTS